MVTFYHFVRGALLTMMGRSDTDLPLLRAKSETAMRKKPGRTEYQRGILEFKDGEWCVHLTGAQGSGHPALDVGGELLRRARARAGRR